MDTMFLAMQQLNHFRIEEHYRIDLKVDLNWVLRFDDGSTSSFCKNEIPATKHEEKLFDCFEPNQRNIDNSM